MGLALVALSFLSIAPQAKAQKLGLGVRLGGYTSGVSGKYYLNDNAAIEGIVGTSFGRRGVQITGLYQLHAPALGLPNLQWFYGAGAHVGSFERGYYYKHHHKHHNGPYKEKLTTVGLDGIVGLEYQITEIPFTIGLDFKPFIDVNGDGVFLFPDGALTIRYMF